MKNKIWLLSVFLTVSACNMQQRFSNTCSSYGFQPGTNEFAQCMQTQDIQFRQAMSQWTQQQQQNNAIYSQQMTSTTNAVMQNMRPMPSPAPFNNQINCQSYVSGQYLNTNCH